MIKNILGTVSFGKKKVLPENQTLLPHANLACTAFALDLH